MNPLGIPDFLPAWPPALNPMVLFAAVLLVGLVAGEYARRFRLPTITGFIVIGFLLGPSVSGTFGPDIIAAARPFVEIALGLILYQLGRLLDVRAIRADKGLLVTSAAECLASFALVWFALTQLVGMNSLHAAVVAVIGISASPAVLLVVARDLGASGPVTSRALNLVALNNVVAFLAYTMLLPLLLAEQRSPLETLVLHPAWQLLVALLLAWALTHLKLRLARLVGRGEAQQFALSLGFIIAALGLATMFEASMLLTLLALGVLSRNLDQQGALTDVQFGHLASVFFIILFVMAGASLHAAELAHAGWAAVAFVLARAAGKWLGVYAGTQLTGGSREHARLIGFALVPMASMAIGLVDLTRKLYRGYAAELAAIVLGAIAVLETVGPIATEFALRRAGETPENSQLEH
jgi:Kef-type K+ transport system membrane component KefB